MSKTNKIKEDLIGDEWKESTEDSFYKPDDDFGEPVESYFDESKRKELAVDEIERLTNEALSRKLVGRLDSKADGNDIIIKQKSSSTIQIKNKVSNKNSIYLILSILTATIIIILAYYYTFHTNLLSRHQGLGMAVLVGITIRTILGKLNTNRYAIEINPFYVKIDKSITTTKTNATIFFDDILGISLTADDFKNIDSNSKFDGIIQYIEDVNRTEITDSTLYIYYEKDEKQEIMPIDFDKVEFGKIELLRLTSSLLRSNIEQRQEILSAHNFTYNSIDEELPKQDKQSEQSENNDSIDNSKNEVDNITNELIKEDTIVENSSSTATTEENSDIQKYELCYDRPGNLMFSGKKDVIKINTKNIFLNYGICDEEDDITIAFDDIIGIAYDEYEAKEGVSEKTRELESYTYSREDEEVSIYHKQGNRSVNTKVYIYKTDSKKGEFFDLIILLYKHNEEQRKKILQVHES